jgi:hypothetical protein
MAKWPDADVHIVRQTVQEPVGGSPDEVALSLDGQRRESDA